jgi:endonuclease YncB( thermonuclease family)
MARIAAWLLFAAVSLGLAAALATAVGGRASLSGHGGKTAAGAKEPSQSSSETAQSARPPDSAAKTPESALLQRMEPRAPLSGLAAPGPPPPPPDPESLPKRWRMVHQPVATAAGILEADGMTLVLPGIDVVAINETCISPSGQSWPCGMAARTAFRAYLRGRALNCHLPDASAENAIPAECLLQGEDPALWLISQGWARAKRDGPFGAEGQAAEAARRGVFGPPPR